MNEPTLVILLVVATAGIALPLGWWWSRRHRSAEVATLRAEVERQQQTAAINEQMQRAVVRNFAVGVHDVLRRQGSKPT